jgi:hypothetical protein
MNRSYLNLTLLMLKFLHSLRANFFVLFLGLIPLACLPCASAQTADFFLQASPPNPSAVDPGINSSANVTLGSTNGFNSAVALSCAITPVEPANAPTCTVSPASATPPSSPSLTFTTTGQTPPTQYTVTVTGVSGGQTASVTLNPITVLAVSPEYSLTVATALSPSTVPAGSGATAVLNISSTDGYSGNVTPGCSSITPPVEPSPVCSFNPATVTVTDGALASTTLTISTTNTKTTGTTTTTSAKVHWRAFYGLLISLPFVVIAGFWGAGGRRGKLLSWFCVLGIVSGLAALPACNSTTVNNGNITPNNSYTFTITAYDQNGVSASNTNVTVSLTVN